MKLAITGKGGVGKTTLSAMLVRYFSDLDETVLAIDADPSTNLAEAIGFQDVEKIIPMISMSNLIEERTGAKPGTYGGVFKLNPTVDDIPDKYSTKMGNIKLVVMGGIRKAGSGCACPENTFLKSLLQHIMLERNEVIIVDMEAGVEHLGRGTAMGVDFMIIVVEPGKRSCDVAIRINELANQIGIKKIFIVANKVRKENDKDFIISKLGPLADLIIAYLPYSDEVIDADMGNAMPYNKDLMDNIVTQLN